MKTHDVRYKATTLCVARIQQNTCWRNKPNQVNNTTTTTTTTTTTRENFTPTLQAPHSRHPTTQRETTWHLKATNTKSQTSQMSYIVYPQTTFPLGKTVFVYSIRTLQTPRRYWDAMVVRTDVQVSPNSAEENDFSRPFHSGHSLDNPWCYFGMHSNHVPYMPKQLPLAPFDHTKHDMGCPHSKECRQRETGKTQHTAFVAFALEPFTRYNPFSRYDNCRISVSLPGRLTRQHVLTDASQARQQRRAELEAESFFNLRSRITVAGLLALQLQRNSYPPNSLPQFTGSTLFNSHRRHPLFSATMILCHTSPANESVGRPSWR